MGSDAPLPRRWEGVWATDDGRVFIIQRTPLTVSVLNQPDGVPFRTPAGKRSGSEPTINLAASFVPNADFTEWVINLRPGVQLHNGKPVDAQLVKANQEFLKASALTGAAYEPVDSFSTEGDMKVVVKMVKPWMNYPYALATQIGVIVDQD